MEYLALHRKTQAIFVLRRYRKAALLGKEGQLEELKFDLRNSEISHNMIARNFGFFVDGEFITLVEEFLDGQTMQDYMRERREGFSETEIGAKICEVLTAVNFLHSHGFVHGCIDQLNVVNSLVLSSLPRTSARSGVPV
jgi:serine/threonine protein kinase